MGSEMVEVETGLQRSTGWGVVSDITAGRVPGCQWAHKPSASTHAIGTPQGHSLHQAQNCGYLAGLQIEAL